MTYKKLSKADVSTLKDLLKVFGQAFGEMGTYQEAVPSDEYLKKLLSKEDFIVLVAVDEDQVIGGLAAHVLEKFEQERKEIYIYDLAVLENYRRQGIATGLINQLKLLAKELKAYVIFVQADRGDEPAIKLYESLGTKEETYNFDIKIEES